MRPLGARAAFGSTVLPPRLGIAANRPGPRCRGSGALSTHGRWRQPRVPLQARCPRPAVRGRAKRRGPWVKVRRQAVRAVTSGSARAGVECRPRTARARSHKSIAGRWTIRWVSQSRPQSTRPKRSAEAARGSGQASPVVVARQPVRLEGQARRCVLPRPGVPSRMTERPSVTKSVASAASTGR